MNKTTRHRSCYIKQRRRELQDAGLCIDCQNPTKKLRCPECLTKNCKSKLRSQRRLTQERLLTGICIVCGTSNAEKDRKYCRRCLDNSRKWTHANKWKLIYEVLLHYSNGDLKCDCCGERSIQFLTIDHINGGGRKEFAAHGSSKNLYRYLIRSNFPEGYRVYCMNCNFGRQRNMGECPHKGIHEFVHPLILALDPDKRYVLVENR
jgi:hypothetical protein